MDEDLKRTLEQVAGFYDRRKVGHVGPLGFRRSTDLMKMLACLDRLKEENILLPGESTFLDLGCADGRVNVFLSYLTKISVGIELDEWTLDDYAPLRAELDAALEQGGFQSVPKNVSLFHGDSTDEAVHRAVFQETGLEFAQFDIFYTYLVMHEEFSELIASRAKKGAFFMVFGLDKIMPKYKGLRLMDRISPLEGILAVYEKK